MLKMNIFMFTITLSLRKRSAEEYEHQNRIKEIREELETKKLNHFHW